MLHISYIIVNIDQQRLFCLDHDKNKISDYPISTSSFGLGNKNGSYQTPLGVHSIAQKIGDGCSINEVFVGREPLGVLDELITSGVGLPGDIVSSRILWLKGEEPGVNSGNNNQGELVDSYQRYIYIHGTSEEDKIGKPASHGCVRMKNKDVIELFDMVDVGCKVIINEK